MLVVAAAGWGLFWLPLREFQAAGLSAGWASAVQFVMPAIVLAPVALFLALQGKPVGFSRWQTAIFTGGAWALYADSLLLTDVARALILFYVTPAWSTALEIWLMKRRLTPTRIIAIVLGLGGLYVILGGDGSLPIPRNAGDWMALLSGMSWAYGSTRIRMAPEATLFENAFSFFTFGAIVTLALAFLPIEAMGAPPTRAEFVALLPWILLMTFGFLIPAMLMQLYGTKLVDPGRVGILFQMEAVVGIASAALLTDEPFGWMEAIGSILVISAAFAEVLGPRLRRSPNGTSATHTP
jgi:drug/metabolite transporter (DMT)-like permease